MPHLSHDGLKLPLFSADEVAWNTFDLEDRVKEAQRLRQSHIVRFARLNAHTDLGLAKTLELADNLFPLAATICDADIVEHQWGFARIPDDLPQPRTGELIHTHPSLPIGMSLVARVAVLDPRPKATHDDVYERAKSDTKIYDELEANLKGYPDQAVERFGALWADVTANQFKLYVPHGAAANAARLALIDIEPNILIVQNTNKDPSMPVVG